MLKANELYASKLLPSIKTYDVNIQTVREGSSINSDFETNLSTVVEFNSNISEREDFSKS
jgi:hypothetical protein